MLEHLDSDAAGLQAPGARVDLANGAPSGSSVVNSERTVGDLAGIFENEPARQAMDQSQVVYRVSAHLPVSDGTEAGLFYGASYLEPGRVGDEYFMTKGHFHQKRHAAEYYWGIRGDGVLLLMDEQRRCWGERVTPGSLHYIPGNVAHRLVNVGDETLAVGACWPSDAGHDYATIAELGFSSRIKCVDGVPELAPVGA